MQGGYRRWRRTQEEGREDGHSATFPKEVLWTTFSRHASACSRELASAPITEVKTNMADNLSPLEKNEEQLLQVY